ncbi:MAG: PASTA domain-containing protein [Gaiellaceae bacterium]
MSVKTSLTLSLAAVALLLSGCGSESKPQAVPDLRGERLDVAERHLDDTGLEYERIGGGALGIVVRSHWRVCDQEPTPGVRARKVRLIVARTCLRVPPARARPIVPDLVGRDLDEAKDLLEELGFRYDVVSWDVGEPVADRLWEVCDQAPRGGAESGFVELYVERDC